MFFPAKESIRSLKTFNPQTSAAQFQRRNAFNRRNTQPQRNFKRDTSAITHPTVRSPGYITNGTSAAHYQSLRARYEPRSSTARLRTRLFSPPLPTAKIYRARPGPTVRLDRALSLISKIASRIQPAEQLAIRANQQNIPFLFRRTAIRNLT